MDYWTRKQTHPGTEFHANGLEDRLVVKRVRWTRPGFHASHGRMASGWAILVDGEQYGPAHPSATAAMRHAEQPGVAKDIARKLNANEVKPGPMEEDDDTEEVLRDYIVKAVMDWAEEGADGNAVALIRDAAANYRTWLAAQPKDV